MHKILNTSAAGNKNKKIKIIITIVDAEQRQSCPSGKI